MENFKMWLTLLALTPASLSSAPVRSFGAQEAFTFASDLQATDDGGVVVVGRTQGSLAAPAQGPGSGDAFMVRLDAQGRTLWARQWGSTGKEEATSVVRDGEGFWAAVQHNGAEGLGELGLKGYSSAILRINGEGEVERAFSVPALIEDIVLTSEGELVLCGARITPQSGAADFFLAQHAPDGRQRWAQVPSAPETDEHCRSVYAHAGGVVATGRAMSPILEAKATPMPGLRSEDEILGGLLTTSVSAAGRVQWSHLVAGQRFGWGQQVVVDAAGDAWVAASFEHIGASPNRTEAALLRFSPTGHAQLVHAVDMVNSERTRDDLVLHGESLIWSVGLPHRAPEGLPAAELVMSGVRGGEVGPWVAVDALRRGARIYPAEEGLLLLGLTCQATPFHAPSPYQGCDPAVRALPLP